MPADAKTVTELWRLLDDIDTLDDACKSDDAAFRKRAYEIQRKRFNILSGDEFDRLAASPPPAASPASPSGVRDKLADLIDEVAEVRGEHISDHAVLQNADEIADAILKQFPSLASDATPAPTSGSEDGGGPYTCIRCLSDTWNDDDICDDCKSEPDSALAKPASAPAGGGVLAEKCLRLADALEDQYGGIEVDDPKFGRFTTGSLLRDAASALSSSAGPAVEPVAWVPQSHLDFLAEGRASNRPSNALVHDRPNEEMGWNVPLFAHPAPATVEMRDLRIALFDLVEAVECSVDMSQRVALGRCLEKAKALCERPAALAPATEGRKS